MKEKNTYEKLVDMRAVNGFSKFIGKSRITVKNMSDRGDESIDKLFVEYMDYIAKNKGIKPTPAPMKAHGNGGRKFTKK